MRIGAELLRRIREHAVAAYPDECCGALLGRDEEAAAPHGGAGAAGGTVRVVRDLCPIDNSWDAAPPDGAGDGMTARRRFLITPEDYRRCEAAAKERGLDLVGFYHSHPDHPARPSEYDRQHAFPWFSYLIVSVEHGKAALATSWLLAEDMSRFDEEPIHEGDGPAPAAAS